MSDELRDRIGTIILNTHKAWWEDEDNALDMPDYQAQAIIDDLGLTVEERLTEFGIDDPGYQSRVVGKWEEK